MKKSLLIASLLLFGSTNIMAAKVGETNFGIGFGGLNSQATSKINAITYDADISTTYEAIGFGKYFNFGRIGANIGLMNKDKGTDGKFIALGYDYVFYNNSKLVPFIGTSISYSWNTWKGRGISIDHNGLLYGIEAGSVYELSNKIDLEIGARYNKSTINGDKTINGTKIEIDVDSAIQYYFSVAYKF